MKIRTIIIVLLSLIMVTLTGCSSTALNKNNEYILMVKNGHPNDRPNSTYGEAFKNFFGSPTWKYFKSDDGKDVVDFTGDCIYQDVEVKAMQQFILNVDAGTFEAGSLSFNEVPQNALITAGMLSKVFDSDSTTEEDTESTTAQDTQPTAAPTMAQDTQAATTSTKENANDPYEWAPGIKAKFENDIIKNGYADSLNNISYEKANIYNNQGYYKVYTKIDGKECFVVSVNVKTGEYHG
ncbi:MAG: hypothetical protein ACI8WT_004653 [Clostridium sp.]|jgi:hypothetical protein